MLQTPSDCDALRVTPPSTRPPIRAGRALRQLVETRPAPPGAKAAGKEACWSWGGRTFGAGCCCREPGRTRAPAFHHIAGRRSPAVTGGATCACHSAAGSGTISGARVRSAMVTAGQDKRPPIERVWRVRGSIGLTEHGNCTWTSFSLRDTRFTMSRRAALSGLGLALYAASRIALSFALKHGEHWLVMVRLPQRLPGCGSCVQHTRFSSSCPWGVARTSCSGRTSRHPLCLWSRRYEPPNRPCCGESSKEDRCSHSAAESSPGVGRERSVGWTYWSRYIDIDRVIEDDGDEYFEAQQDMI